MKITKIELEQINESYLQSLLWTKIKKTSNSKSSWQALAFKTTNNNKILVLYRTLIYNFYLAYIAHPKFSDKEIKEVDIEYENKKILQIAKELKNYLPKKTVFVRFDLMYHTKRTVQEPYKELSITFKYLKKAADDIQPKNTAILNLKLPIEKIMEGMKKKTRYNIRLGIKKNIKILVDTKYKYLNDFYSLYKETAQRDKFTIHSKDYIRNVIYEFQNDKNATIKLLVAIFEEKVIAGIIVGIYKNKATYLYGASSNTNRQLMPNYILQFETIKILKNMNVKEYDLLGIPPCENIKHPMLGLYQFKTGFNPSIIHRTGCYDFVYKNFYYFVYKKLEQLRYFYYKVLKKRV